MEIASSPQRKWVINKNYIKDANVALQDNLPASTYGCSHVSPTNKLCTNIYVLTSNICDAWMYSLSVGVCVGRCDTSSYITLTSGSR